MSLVIINTRCANLSSVKFACERLGFDAHISDDISTITQADKLILPGVGTAVAAMQNLADLGLIDTIKALKQPVLGICLGMQLMTEFSQEGDVPLLALMAGQTQKLPECGLPLPHMGWNKVHHTPHPLFDGIAKDSHFYFVHSFAVMPNEHTLATCDYGTTFSAVIAHNNFYGAQFHPERSGKAGSLFLKNFIEKI